MLQFVKFTFLLLPCALVSSPLFERNRVTHQLWPLPPVQFDEPPPGVLQLEPYFNHVSTVIDYLDFALPTYFDHTTIFTVDYLHYHIPFSFYCSFIMRMNAGFWIFIGCLVYGTVYTPLGRRSSRLCKTVLPS